MQILRSLFTVALLVVSVWALSEPDQPMHVLTTADDPEISRQQCIAKYDVPSNLAEKYKRWEYPDDAKTRCYMKCIFEKFGFFTDQTGFDVAKIHQHLSQDGTANRNDGLYAKISVCAEKKDRYGDDQCKWAYYGVMCFIRDKLLIVVDNDKPQH